MDSQTNLLLATVATEATAGSAMGFLIGYRVRQSAAIMLKVKYNNPKGADYANPGTYNGLRFDGDTPTISNVNCTPKNPESTDDVTVIAEVTDRVSGVRKVVVHYSIDSGSWADVPMIGGPTYTGIIPRQVGWTTLQFKIEATDNAGLKSSTAQETYRLGTYVLETLTEPRSEDWWVKLGLPGFPLEAILMGIVLGMTVLALFRKRRSSSTAGPEAH